MQQKLEHSHGFVTIGQRLLARLKHLFADYEPILRGWDSAGW